MYLCNQRFINRLRDLRGKDPFCNGQGDNLVAKVSGNEIRLLQISDLHICCLNRESRTTRGESDTNIRRIKSLYQELVGTFRYETNSNAPRVDGLLVSGDLIDAPLHQERYQQLSATSEIDAVWQFGHDFVCSVLEDVCKDLNIQPEDGLLVVPGNHDIFRGAELINSGVSPKRGESFLNNVHNRLHKGPKPNDCRDLINNPRLCLFGDEDGVVAVFGLDSNGMTYHYRDGLHDFGRVGDQQLTGIEETLNELGKLFFGTPLYVFVVMHHHLLPVEKFEEVERRVSNEYRDKDDRHVHVLMNSVNIDSPDIITRLQKLRVSLISHGHMHSPLIQSIRYHNYHESPSNDTSLKVVGVPSLVQRENTRHIVERPYIGCTVFTIDKFRGTVRIDVLAKRDDSTKIVRSINSPLISISQVSPEERRVYRRVHSWLRPRDPQPPDDVPYTGSPSEDDGLDRFRGAFDRLWCEAGYTLISSLPRALTGDDGSDLLFPNVIWRNDYPKKKHYRLLVVLLENNDSNNDPYILLNNHIPIRDSNYGAWQAPLLPAFNSLEQLLINLRNDLCRMRDDLETRKPMQVIEDKRKRQGVENAMRLLGMVGPDSFDDKMIDLAKREFTKFSPVDGQPQLYEYTLTAIESFTLRPGMRGSLADAIRTLMISSPEHAYRWELGREQAMDGYVWFPFRHWRQCKAIVSRNADVMAWLEQVLGDLGTLRDRAPWLYCGITGGVDDSLRINRVTPHPFDEVAGEENTVCTGPISLVTGLRHVRLQQQYDLGGVRPYETAEIKLVLLRKENKELDNSARDRIGVYDQCGNQLIGYLRPVQRYVLSSGLRRAKNIREAVGKISDVDPAKLNGYITIHRSIGDQIALLPPIIEGVPSEEREVIIEDGKEIAEYLVCDGNHRIVQYCWRDKHDVLAVLISNPSERYYAYPASCWSWNITSRNEIRNSPDLYGKYSPRLPDQDNNLERQSGEHYGHNWYRRFYRDFSTAFDSGTQGGIVSII